MFDFLLVVRVLDPIQRLLHQRHLSKAQFLVQVFLLSKMSPTAGVVAVVVAVVVVVVVHLLYVYFLDINAIASKSQVLNNFFCDYSTIFQQFF